MKSTFKLFPIAITASVASLLTIPPSGSVALPSDDSQAVNSQLKDKEYLSLVSVRANEITVGTRNTEYYFTINIPKSSHSLQKVNIAQRGGYDIIRFHQQRIRAYVIGEIRKEIKIANIEPESQGISITFAEPVEPGQRLTVVMGVKENPLNDGNYLFVVTVFPEGKLDMGQSLGVGRLRITSVL
ncbi:DUF2808 domain-containing protein [Calothrix sp. NIES-3974]|uniref:DUF2808 domain-containing protein n=1 Tax=Calothrix sp. NIES-3974 TaxID=2005462 RepID=UPI000B5EAE7F|nr:DUF2808 domain-containing protein [Calothrix sp. NIES-3974]BAZ05691.1 hypothetical protein NIES3974_23440 [Calothrix sp. NIES-3974]